MFFSSAFKYTQIVSCYPLQKIILEQPKCSWTIHQILYNILSINNKQVSNFICLQAAQYIGEMCRYILATPPKPEDTQHKLRIIFGNGLKAQIWKEFVTRFNIPRVAEFYGSTEGNANIGKPILNRLILCHQCATKITNLSGLCSGNLPSPIELICSIL